MDLIEQYRQMHRERAYGATSIKKAPYILPYIQLLKARSVIDYGCGQSSLAELISGGAVPTVTRYDPGLPAYDKRPNGRFDLLVNIDVLEHVPEDDVDGVIADMAALSDKAIIIVDTRPAATTLSDGRNAHLTLRPAAVVERTARARHYPARAADMGTTATRVLRYVAPPLRRRRWQPWHLAGTYKMRAMLEAR